MSDRSGMHFCSRTRDNQGSKDALCDKSQSRTFFRGEKPSVYARLILGYVVLTYLDLYI